MEGKLTKIGDNWFIVSNGHNYLLHPTDVMKINNDSIVFDNIESRIACYPDVTFEIVFDGLEYGKIMTKS